MYIRYIKITANENIASKCNVRGLSLVKVYRDVESIALAQSTRGRERRLRKMSKSRNTRYADGNDFGGIHVKCSGSCWTEAFRYWQTVITFHEQSHAIYIHSRYILRLLDYTVAREGSFTFVNFWYLQCTQFKSENAQKQRYIVLFFKTKTDKLKLSCNFYITSFAKNYIRICKNIILILI